MLYIFGFYCHHRPFIPAIDPNNPFEELPLKFRNIKSSEIKRHSLPDLHYSKNKKSKNNNNNSDRCRSSGDIRSVVELFSSRRNAGNPELPVKSSLGSKQRLGRSSLSLSSFGHLKTAHDFQKSLQWSSNLTLRPRMSTAAFEELMEIRDKLYTPLSIAHKDNIVADCIPYNRVLTPSLASIDVDDDFSWLESIKSGRAENNAALDALSLSSTDII